MASSSLFISNNATSTTSALPTDLGAVATRIQERALALASERIALAEATDQLKAEDAILQHETRKITSTRRTLLLTLRSRHGVELELFRLQQEHEIALERQKQIEKQTQSTLLQTQQKEKLFLQVTQDVYAPHTTKTALFKKYAQGTIDRSTERIEKRREQLGRLVQSSNAMEEEMKYTAAETKRMQNEIKTLEDQEEREDEEAASLALDIKALLAKRTSLRYAIQDAKDSRAA